MKDGSRYKSLIYCLVFLLLTAVILRVYFRIITPKYFTEQIYSTTTTYQGFYDMKRNTVDVLFLGPSKGTCAFQPQELYNEYGIRSYNLSCEDQSILTSYYWLKEALKRQEPKAVVFDISRAFLSEEAGPLGSDPDLTRKAFDFMRWSPNKMRAVMDICSLEEGQTVISYLLPNIRYHDRGDSISRKDFLYRKMSKDSELKGYTLIPLRIGDDFEGFDFDGAEPEPMNPDMVPYLDMTVQLCQSRGIDLIMTFTPMSRQKVGQCLAAEMYAEQMGVRMVDFNRKEILEESGYDFGQMNSDKQHSNIWGSVCITDYLGGILAREYGIQSVQDEQWERTREFFDFTLKQAGLIYMTDMDEYTAAVSDDRYSIVESMSDDGTRYDIFEKRTGRQVDSVLIGEDDNGKTTFTHIEVDIN